MFAQDYGLQTPNSAKCWQLVPLFKHSFRFQTTSAGYWILKLRKMLKITHADFETVLSKEYRLKTDTR